MHFRVGDTFVNDATYINWLFEKVGKLITVGWKVAPLPRDASIEERAVQARTNEFLFRMALLAMESAFSEHFLVKLSRLGYRDPWPTKFYSEAITTAIRYDTTLIEAIGNNRLPTANSFECRIDNRPRLSGH